MGANKMDIWLRAKMQNVTRWAPISYKCDKLQQVKHEFCRGSQSIGLMIGLRFGVCTKIGGSQNMLVFLLKTPCKSTTI